MRLIKVAAGALVCLLLSMASPAQSVNVTMGSLIQSEASGGVAVLTFNFSVADPASHDGVTMFTGGPGDDGVTGFQTCAQLPWGCTASDIISIGTSIPLYFAPPGSMWSVPGADGTIAVSCWNGGGGFNYVKGFRHKLDAKTGILTVNGVVAPRVSFTQATPYPECNATGPVYTMVGHWRYAAQFVQNPEHPGYWVLTQMQIVPVL